jgi:hypothetical protein
MNDKTLEEINNYFKISGICSVSFLCRKFKVSKEKAYEYIEILSKQSCRYDKNSNGKIVRIYLDI